MMFYLIFLSLDCPPCYSLVQERVNVHRGKLRELNNLILNIGNDPTAFNDTKFLAQLMVVNDSVNNLLDEARGASSKNCVGFIGMCKSILKIKIEMVLFTLMTDLKNMQSGPFSLIVEGALHFCGKTLTKLLCW